jgi:predicted nucleotidyltransferase
VSPQSIEPLPDELASLLARHVAHLAGVELVYLFGSRARGEARPDSDLDLALRFAPGSSTDEREQIRRKRIATLTDALGELGERTDILDLDHASSSLAFRIVREGRCIHACSQRAQVSFVSSVARRYDDDAPRRRLFQETALRVGREMGRRADG